MQKEILEAVDILKRGGLVALPTETVYGLGADATNPAAIRKIFTAKGRPVDHPLIVHIGSPQQLSDWAVEISDDALCLAQHFWPGPLTLILKKAPHVSDLITGGQDSIGLRVPNHPVALELLRTLGIGLAAPSANRFGRISPTTAAAVREELGNQVDLILEGGRCAVGVESTIIDMRGESPVILRPGIITAQEIKEVLGKSISYPAKQSIRISGNLESHYAPQTPLELMSAEEMLAFYQLPDAQKLPCVLLTRQSLMSKDNLKVMTLQKDPHRYAHDLYDVLRTFDKEGLKVIVVENVPENETWDAIRDRLLRASHR